MLKSQWFNRHTYHRWRGTCLVLYDIRFLTLVTFRDISSTILNDVAWSQNIPDYPVINWMRIIWCYYFELRQIYGMLAFRWMEAWQYNNIFRNWPSTQITKKAIFLLTHRFCVWNSLNVCTKQNKLTAVIRANIKEDLHVSTDIGVASGIYFKRYFNLLVDFDGFILVIWPHAAGRILYIKLRHFITSESPQTLLINTGKKTQRKWSQLYVSYFWHYCCR